MDNNIKRNNKCNTILDVLVLIVCLISLIVVPVLLIGVHYNIVGEVFGIIGTLTAIVTATTSIIYTEKSRIKQNKYQYQKDKLERTMDKLGEALYEQIEVINPAKIINVPIDLSNPNKMIDYMLTSIVSYKFSLVVSGNRIFWYYDEQQQKDSTVLEKFINDLDEAIMEIDLVLNELMDTLRKLATKLSENKMEKTLEENAELIKCVIEEVYNNVGKNFNELDKIRTEKVEALYDKAKCVLKEYETYKYERIEK